jgi:tetratricopeptide (TPR) repeat protein
MPVTPESLPGMLAAAREASARSVLERYYAPVHLPEAGGVSIASKWLDRHPEDARGNFYLASLLVARRMMEGPERFDRELIFRRAMEHSGRDPFFTLMAARSIDSGIEGPDREENLRLVLLRSVADRGAAAALVDIGRLYLDVMRQPRRADEYAEMALSVNPLSLRAGILDYDIAVDMGWGPMAKTMLNELVLRHPSAAAARLRLGRAALEGGRHRQALTEFHAVLAVDAGNREALDGAVTALGMLGQTSAAADLLLRHIECFPHDFDLRLKLAELYRTLGRDADATGVLALALETAPDDPAALAIRADILRASAAAGPPPAPADGGRRQEIDLSPAAVPPANGWEYLYFQTEDVMEPGGAIHRGVSFAVRIYTERAARMLRHLSLWLDSDLERSRVRRLDIIGPGGERQRLTPPPGADADDALRFRLPPLRTGMVVEAEVEILREPAPFLGEYFGHIAPLSQLAPVRLSRYMFSAPKERRVHFRPVNGAPEAMVVESADGKTVTRIWEMSNLPAFIPEPYAPGQADLAPSVQVSSFGDWDEFARWYWRLIGVQYHAPPELRLLANRMAEGGGAPLAVLERAAAWISRNIVQRQWEYGPYAFRPVNARSILSRLTADGKDRTLLLCLLAREYGLEAWPVLSRFRDGRAAPPGSDALDLPLLDHFNYSLSLVHPALGGDVFMDASNPHRPPGVMPPQLSGSPGIAVSPQGAERIHIPDAGVQACEWEAEADMVVDSDGSILWEEKVEAAGVAAERLRAMFPGDGDAGSAWDGFLRSFGSDPSTSAGDFSPLPAEPARAGWQGRGRLRRFAAMEDDRVVLTVPPLPAGGDGYPLNLTDIASYGERGQDVLLPHGFRISRRITIRYPAGWRLVNQAQPFSVDYPFASAALTWEAEPGEATIGF